MVYITDVSEAHAAPFRLVFVLTKEIKTSDVTAPFGKTKKDLS
jgi:hypothetical protein